jgi:hypothetical protein
MAFVEDGTTNNNIHINTLDMAIKVLAQAKIYHLATFKLMETQDG